jgi:hypothetical protein
MAAERRSDVTPWIEMRSHGECVPDIAGGQLLGHGTTTCLLRVPEPTAAAGVS